MLMPLDKTVKDGDAAKHDAGPCEHSGCSARHMSRAGAVCGEASGLRNTDPRRRFLTLCAARADQCRSIQNTAQSRHIVLERPNVKLAGPHTRRPTK